MGRFIFGKSRNFSVKLRHPSRNVSSTAPKVRTVSPLATFTTEEGLFLQMLTLWGNFDLMFSTTQGVIAEEKAPVSTKKRHEKFPN